ncbi:MAG TPA: hypothetical protein PLK12_00495 [Prolixibacteraceae bacterium]|nr:hypothetical protein [Prolixibacteraceae bacterium]
METLQYFHRPTISESIGNGWYVMKKYFLWLFLAVIISGIFHGGPFQQNYEGGQSFPVLGLWIIVLILIGITVFLLVKPVFSFGAAMMFVQGVRDQKPELRYLVSGFKENYLNIVLAHLLRVAIVGIGLVALVIPGIIFACRLAFVPYLVMDKGLDPVQSVEESWRLTRGYGWTLFGLGLASIFIFIGGLICLVVGVFPAMILINASFASMYQAILTEKGKMP